jgi:hypothetical protein
MTFSGDPKYGVANSVAVARKILEGRGNEDARTFSSHNSPLPFPSKLLEKRKLTHGLNALRWVGRIVEIE